jgi:hypothetical protein
MRPRTGLRRIDNPNVVGQLEKLSEQELDDLPFGVIRINSAGRILFYSQTEAGFPDMAKSRRALTYSSYRAVWPAMISEGA